jgi:hypothetical protein
LGMKTSFLWNLYEIQKYYKDNKLSKDIFKTFLAFAVADKNADKNETSTYLKTIVYKTKNENSSKTAKL